MKNLPLLVGTIIITLLLVGAIGYFFSRAETQEIEAAKADPTLVVGDARNARGNLDSAITVVEFSDFGCPACASTEPFVNQFYGEYQDKVKFVYRHFPIDASHPNARMAAQAAEVVAMDDKFWEYKTMLYDRQNDWSGISDQNELINLFAEYAQELEIDKQTFLERIELPTVISLVETDKQDGLEVGVDATPTFFVNGEKVPAPQLPTVVDSLLEVEVTATESAEEPS